MADENQSFPMLPVKHWWMLRNKFKQSIPGTVTANYLSTVLNMKENSARTNVLPYLVRLGIIDEDGKTGDRARRWRDDVEYPEVCKEILSDTYPMELLEAVPNPNEDREDASRWFANHTGAGQNAVGRMTSQYVLITKADPSDGAKAKALTNKTASQKKQPRTNSQTKVKAKAKPEAGLLPKDPPPPLPDPQGRTLPGININLEVHISSDATPDQIDQIFESMAKHIYDKQ